MNTKDEETRWEDERMAMSNEEEKQAGANEKKSSTAKKVAGFAAAGAAGIAAGIGLSSMAEAHGTQVSDSDVPPVKDAAHHAGDVEMDGDVKTATVSDDMSFSEAFASARKQVGAGGVFEWRGKLYNTYYKEEWDSMSQQEKDQYMAEALGYKSTNTSSQEVEVEGKLQENIADGAHDVEAVVDDNGNPVTIAFANVGGHNSILVNTDSNIVMDSQATDIYEGASVDDTEVVAIPEGDISVGDTLADTSCADSMDGMDSFCV